MNQIIKKIVLDRQTVKSYSDKKISDNDWNQILDSIHWSPSSHGFEPYRVLIIKKNNPIRNLLRAMMWNQGVVTEADKLIFFISLNRESFMNKEWLYDRSLRKITKVLGKKEEEAKQEAKNFSDIVYTKHLSIEEPHGDDWAMKQAYIALGFSIFSAAILGIGTTPMEGLEKEKIESLFLKKKLINSNERIAVGAAFGYPKSKSAYSHFGSGKRIRDSKTFKFKTI